MPKFRKKPVVIEAEQFIVGIKWPRGVCGCIALAPHGPPHLHTMHQGQSVELADGDWVIPERDGEHYYPCKPDVFAATYEPLEERTPTLERELTALLNKHGEDDRHNTPDFILAGFLTQCLAAVAILGNWRTVELGRRDRTQGDESGGPSTEPVR